MSACLIARYGAGKQSAPSARPSRLRLQQSGEGDAHPLADFQAIEAPARVAGVDGGLALVPTCAASAVRTS